MAPGHYPDRGVCARRCPEMRNSHALPKTVTDTSGIQVGRPNRETNRIRAARDAAHRFRERRPGNTAPAAGGGRTRPRPARPRPDHDPITTNAENVRETPLPQNAWDAGDTRDAED
ncbi:hypothetical protein GCM10010420_06800 [Streptomyces glaucosporus]|uniref:Uncharacterized protein n=1 Tax=Streptomyces glaucosporus TaxID=284044 RepID=A0ABP5UV55_9ACTN